MTLTTAKDYDPEDDEPWDNPIARLMSGENPLTPKPSEKEKVPLIEYNECPCCHGKGFVKIIHEELRTKKDKK